MNRMNSTEYNEQNSVMSPEKKNFSHLYGRSNYRIEIKSIPLV